MICFECGGVLTPVCGEGRTLRYKGASLVIPYEVEIPTCVTCGADFLDAGLTSSILDLVLPSYLEGQREHLGFLVQTIRERTGLSLRSIEKACGVVPTYLGHALAGDCAVEAMLVSLLESFALNPSEVARQLAKSGPFDTNSVKEAL